MGGDGGEVTTESKGSASGSTGKPKAVRTGQPGRKASHAGPSRSAGRQLHSPTVSVRLAPRLTEERLIYRQLPVPVFNLPRAPQVPIPSDLAKKDLSSEAR